jgi:hypothetical protein
LVAAVESPMRVHSKSNSVPPYVSQSLIVWQQGRPQVFVKRIVHGRRPPYYLIRAGAGGLLVVIGGCGVEFGDSELTAPLE